MYVAFTEREDLLMLVVLVLYYLLVAPSGVIRGGSWGLATHCCSASCVPFSFSLRFCFL